MASDRDSGGVLSWCPRVREEEVRTVIVAYLAFRQCTDKLARTVKAIQRTAIWVAVLLVLTAWASAGCQGKSNALPSGSGEKGGDRAAAAQAAILDALSDLEKSEFFNNSKCDAED